MTGPRHRSPDAPRPSYRPYWIAAGAVTVVIIAASLVAMHYGDAISVEATKPAATTTRALPTPAPIFPTDATVPDYAMGTEGTETTTNALSAPKTVSERVTVYMDRPGPTTTLTATQTVTATATATVIETSTATVTQTVIAEPPVIQEEETP